MCSAVMVMIDDEEIMQFGAAVIGINSSLTRITSQFYLDMNTSILGQVSLFQGCRLEE
jgi:hypothetical protein